MRGVNEVPSKRYGRDRGELGLFMVVNCESAIFFSVNREFTKKVARIVKSRLSGVNVNSRKKVA